MITITMIEPRASSNAASSPRRSFWQLALAALSLTGFAGGEHLARAQTPVNKMCPVMTLEEADPAITVQYRDQTIAFCCQRCVEKFLANSERYVDRLSIEEDAAGVTTPASRSNSPDAREGVVDGHGWGQAGHEEESAGDSHRRVGEHKHAGADPAHHHATHADKGRPSFAGKLVNWLGRFHPASVNFPTAMLVAAAIAELLLVRTDRSLYSSAGRFCLWFGALSAVVAGTLGWFFAGFRLSDDQWIMTTHRWLGTATVAWSVLLLVVGERAFRKERPEKRRLYRLLLFIGVIAVMVTGFFGGSLIYGLDHYAW